MTFAIAAPLISASALSEQLNQNTANLRILDCRFQLNDPQQGYQQYQQDHLPGALYVNLDQDLSATVTKHGGRHPLPDPSTLAATFERLGITSGETWVVAYDDSRFAFVSRLWWLLRYLGHEKVLLLNGGWSAWQKVGGTVATDVPNITLGHFLPQVQSDWIVNIEAVQTRPQTTLLIDSRERDRYDGLREAIDPIAGHIPGAICLPWQEVTDNEGKALSPETLRKRWQAYEGQADKIIYCGSGVTACVNLLSREIAGLPPAKLYPGGWSDWCSYAIV